MIVNGKALAEMYGVDRRTVTNWVNSDPPCPSFVEGRERKFDTAAVAKWHTDRAVATAVAELERRRPADLEEARRRKLVAEAVLAEIAVREKEGELVPADVHQDVVGQMAERLRAVCINAPSNYALMLERVGVDPATAQQVLEQIAEDLTRALRGAADAPDELGEPPVEDAA
jgi:phage terminase Nu1 subunit (DNA packaging protein)